jgi:hypothetical protein
VPLPIERTRAGFGKASFPYASEGSAGGLCTNGGTVGSTVSCTAGRFNDRIVSLQVQVPLNYGCKAGTGPDPTTGITNPATPCVDAASLPQGGWWKIRYTPMKESTSATKYLSMTDATTWSVQLIGDPVHLVQNG